MSVSLYIILMLFLGYKYAGLQYTRQCFCGNEYGRRGVANEADCRAVCPGESKQTCGGTWRNSIYSTGYMGKSK